MNRGRSTGRARGSVLLIVLGIVAVLSFVAAGLYVVTESQRGGFIAIRQHSVAVSRASNGAQDALARLRSGTITTAGLSAYANYDAAFAAADAGTPTALKRVTFVDDGGVAEYDADVFLALALPNTAQTTQRVMIHSTGYNLGADAVTRAQSANLSSAVFELEVQLPVNAPSGYAGSN